MRDDNLDPVASRYDRLLALTAYGLLFVSTFTLWIPALVAAAIAFSHRRGADWRVASHFRFQLKIFWWSLALVALGILALVVAGGFALGAVWSLLVSGGEWDWSAAADTVAAQSGVTAGVLAVGGAGLLGLSALWTLLASAWGAWRLASDRPIGQSGPAYALEPHKDPR